MFRAATVGLARNSNRIFSTSTIKAVLEKEPVKWIRTPDAEYPYETKIGQDKVTLRVGDYPEEPFYTAESKHADVMHSDKFLSNWQVEESIKVDSNRP
jgi:hypothetical protein